MKAETSDADALSFDLEDSVDSTRKAEARELLSAHLSTTRSHEKMVIVRVNPFGSPDFEADVEAVLQDGLDILNLPKVDRAADVVAAIAHIEGRPEAHARTRPLRYLVNIESPAGLLDVADIAAAHPAIMGLQIGFGDLFAPLGVTPGNAHAIAQVRWQVRLAAGHAGIAAYDGAFLDIAAPDAFRADARSARDMGFEGKSCIHPSQIELANEIFEVRSDELAHAQNVVTAAKTAKARGLGAFVVDGRLIDGPLIARAHRILDKARRQSVP